MKHVLNHKDSLTRVVDSRNERTVLKLQDKENGYFGRSLKKKKQNFASIQLES